MAISQSNNSSIFRNRGKKLGIHSWGKKDFRGKGTRFLLRRGPKRQKKEAARSAKIFKTGEPCYENDRIGKRNCPISTYAVAKESRLSIEEEERDQKSRDRQKPANGKEGKIF